jgi:putative ABC transport system permease protein
MGIPLVKGRFFDERDRVGPPDVVIVSEGLARRLWPYSDPIGKILNVADLATLAPRQVVGVVGDVRHSGLHSEPPIEVYRPAFQAYWPFFALVVRTIGKPLELAPFVRQSVATVDRGLPLTDVRTMDELAADSLALRRASMLLMALFTALAIFLASLGIYSVISYAVTLRTLEIGIRMALGARPVNILAATVGQSATLTLIGVVSGLLIAAGVTRYLASFLVDLTARNALTFASASAAMLVIGITAAYFPARRAMGVDPAQTLKCE